VYFVGRLLSPSLVSYLLTVSLQRIILYYLFGDDEKCVIFSMNVTWVRPVVYECHFVRYVCWCVWYLRVLVLEESAVCSGISLGLYLVRSV